jgi:hypothetical protein
MSFLFWVSYPDRPVLIYLFGGSAVSAIDRIYVKKFVQWRAMMAFERMVVSLVYQSFFTLVLHWYEILASRFCRFTSGEIHPVPIK